MRFKVGGYSLNIGFEKNGWPSFCVMKLSKQSIRPLMSDGRIARKGGLRFDVVWGPIIRPIPKFWLSGFWFKRDLGYNPNHQNCYWFILRIPWVVGIFTSIAFGWGERQPGLYFGLKSYEIDWHSAGLKNVDGNLVLNDQGDPIMTWPKQHEIGEMALSPSMSIRKDLVE